MAHLSFPTGSVTIGFSPLLTCMMFGTVFCNVCKTSEEMMERTERWTKPLYTLFFVISGASLDLSVFKTPVFVIIGIIYILFRSLGKYFGSMVSAKTTGCNESTVKYLGITLLPQAGVALGMSVTVMEFGTIGPIIRNIILFSVLIYELIGPVMTKMALTAAGDITQKPKEKNRKERTAPSKI